MNLSIAYATTQWCCDLIKLENKNYKKVKGVYCMKNKRVFHQQYDTWYQ